MKRGAGSMSKTSARAYTRSPRLISSPLSRRMIVVGDTLASFARSLMDRPLAHRAWRRVSPAVGFSMGNFISTNGTNYKDSGTKGFADFLKFHSDISDVARPGIL